MAENYVLLETIQLTQTASSVIFDNIPQTGYTDLKIVICALGGSTEGMYIRFNNSTTGFTGRYLIGDGNTPVSGVLERYIGSIMNQTVTPNNVEVYIPNYTSSNGKSFSVDSSQENTATLGYGNIIAGLWSNSAAISSITLEAANSFRANSSFSLYGVAALNTTPVVAPKATGGNIVANDGTYWYHAFLSSGTFTPQTALTCDVLQIAGGGGGASYRGGGGGAGGLLAYTSQALTAINYPVAIGAGGTGGAESGTYATGNIGTSGSSSRFSSLTASAGGGFGGSPGANSKGASGGSGGGSCADPSFQPNAGGAASPSGQGNAGGAGNTFGGPHYGAGGGGGATAAGTAGTTAGGGAGGAGTSSYSSWGAATLTGQNSGGTYYYAGGGAGGGFGSAPTVSGGLGGGGSSPSNSSGVAGIAGTGGGGGGANATSDNVKNSGANGGSGIVIIRYPMA
jgi:hypothetical protein